MDQPPIKVLLVEDDPADARLIQMTLRRSERASFHLAHASRLGDALNRLKEEGFDVILLDLGLPDSWGPDTFIETHKAASTLPTVILTGLDIQAFAIEAMQLGAQDYLIKGHIDTHILECSIRYAIERKRLEYETIAASEAALEAKRTTSEFLANMSHEIRTPLNAMIGGSSLLLDSGLTPIQREWMQMVHTSGEGLLALINDILDLSRIEAGKLPIEPIPFNLESVVQEVIDMVAVRASEKDLKLVVRYPAQVPRHFLGDPGRVRQVLTNLVANAIKFTHQGHVLIDISCQETAGDPAALEITVEDTGIGIRQEQLEYIFEKFAQAHPSDTQKYGGTGLGLAICRQLVELMGGTIGVTSRLGEGSTFRFNLPLPVVAQEPSQQPSHADPGQAPDRAPKAPVNVRVLVAEDNVFNQKVAAEMLRKLGCRVDVAANGKEAVQMVETFPYDLVFMDCQMPEMDGYQATGEIRKAEGDARHIPIIAMTAHAMQGDRERCLASGMDDYVSKPVRTESLAEILQRYASSSSGPLGSPAIDTTVFNHLKAILGDDAPDLTQSYLDETASLLAAMRQALSQGDWDTLHKSAHTMKGSSATIGAKGLAEICQQLQSLAGADREGQAREKLAELEHGFDRVKGELGKLLV